MKKSSTIFFLFCFIAITGLKAQDWKNFSEGKISGIITEKDKKEGIPGVSVIIKHLRDSTYTKGSTTNEKGEFVFENIRAGRYELYTNAIGMKKFTMTNIPVNPKMPEAKIPAIVLEDDTKTLNEVVIEEKKDFMEVTADAIIINPQNNPNTQSGTAADVLREVPAVRVDESGNVTMRGGRPNILINGRQSNFGGGGGRGGMGGGMGGGGGLDQISADDIESIEINSNPSAKYDADGVSGMINVRLKRDKQTGTHGNVNLAIGNRQRVFGGFRVSHKTKKWATSLGYNTRFDNRLAENITDRTTNLPNNDIQFLNQSRNFKIRSENHNIRAGVEFMPNEKTTFSFDATIGIRQSWNDGDLVTKNFNNGNYTNGNKQGTNAGNNSLSYDFALGYKTELKKKGQEITASIATSLGNGDDRQSLVNRIMMGDGTTTSLNMFTQSSLNNTRNNITTLQFDYVHPLAEKFGTIETGYKAIIRNLNTGFELDSVNKITNNWERNLLRSNDFTYNESVHAAYISYKNRTGKWDYTAGLRFEKVWLDGNTINAAQNTSFKKDYFNIFPTARIAYNFGQGQFIKLSYSKRIDRPNFDDLNPFVDVSNPLNLRQGNPDLNPELIHVLELGYNKFWKEFSISPNIFYRKRWNLSQRVLTLQPDLITTISTPTNIGSSDAFGLDFTGTYDPTKLKWFSLSGGISAFQTTINAGEGQTATINSTVQTWNARLNANFTLWKGGRLQVGYMYNAPTAVAQGENIGFYSFNTGLMQTLDKKKNWSLNLMVRDIFYSMRFGNTIKTDRISQTSVILRDTRMVMLRLNYKF